VHHWQDPIAGMREMRRVARRVVVFTCETTERSWRRRFWLTRDYLPEVAASPVGLATELAGAIGARVEPVLVPWDCADGFFEAYWRRPEAYLDEEVRRGISLWTAPTDGPAQELPCEDADRVDAAGGEIPMDDPTNRHHSQDGGEPEDRDIERARGYHVAVEHRHTLPDRPRSDRQFWRIP
jgi:hypothetical protein